MKHYFDPSKMSPEEIVARMKEIEAAAHRADGDTPRSVLHEVAHAFVDVHHGATFDSVRLDANSGLVSGVKGLPDHRAQVCARLAGVIAERLAGASWDVLDSAKADIAGARHYARSRSEVRDDINRTARLLSSHWESLNAAAKELTKRGKLTSEEFCKVVRDVNLRRDADDPRKPRHTCGAHTFDPLFDRIVENRHPYKPPRVDRKDSADSPRRVIRFDLAPLQPAVEMPNGSLRVQAYLTRCGIFSYTQPDGSERRELRLPEDVLNPKSLASFQGVPFTNDHPAEMISPANATEFAVGAVDGDVQADDDHVRGTITVWDKNTIAEMRAGKTDVSCGYVCDLLEEPGVHPIYGEYDARQINVIGNHLSLVDHGRAGDARLRVDRMDSATHRPHTISTVAPRAAVKATDMSRTPKRKPRADALKGAEERAAKRTANAWTGDGATKVAPLSEASTYRTPKLDTEQRAAKRMRDRTVNAWRHDVDTPTDPDDNSTRGLRGATAAVRDPDKVPDVSDASLIEIKGLIGTFGAYDESVREKLYQPLVDRARELGLDQLADDFEQRYGLFDPSDEELLEDDTDELKQPLQQFKGGTGPNLADAATDRGKATLAALKGGWSKGDRADALDRIVKLLVKRADAFAHAEFGARLSRTDREGMLALLGDEAPAIRHEGDHFLAAYVRHYVHVRGGK